MLYPYNSFRSLGLFPVTVCQALFIAPCSHSFHYKCIRGTLYEHHPGFSCPLCRSFHDLEADVEVDVAEEEEEWEELPEPEITPGIPAVDTAVVDAGADGDGENDISAVLLGDSLALDTMDISDGNGNSNANRRSMDDEDDIPMGFRTAAEDNDTRRVLLPQGLTSHPNGSAANASVSRRPPRRGTMVHGQANGSQAPLIDDTGFETDGGALGYGAETDMDIDEPSRGHGHQHTNSAGNSRNASARNRSTIYNLVHGSTVNASTHGFGSTNEHGSINGHTYAASAGMSSAPNLLRPGSSLGNAHQQHGSSGPGTTTPPTGGAAPTAYAAPVNVRSPNVQSHHHGLASTPGAPRGGLPSSYPSGSAVSHLFGDAGAGTGLDREREEVLSGEDHTVDGTGASGLLGFGGKRKR